MVAAQRSRRVPACAITRRLRGPGQHLHFAPAGIERSAAALGQHHSDHNEFIEVAGGESHRTSKPLARAGNCRTRPLAVLTPGGRPRSLDWGDRGWTGAPVFLAREDRSMRITLLLVLVGLVSVTMPAHAQPLTKSECDEVVMGLTELSRAAAGLLVHVENTNVSPLRAGGETVIRQCSALS